MTQTAYVHRAVIVSPANLSALSAGIAQAIGPSARDDLSFASIRATRDGTEYEVCDVAITTETRAGYQAMMANPALLHGAVTQGWQRKDMDPPAPTLQTVTDWLAASTIWLGDAWSLTGTSIEQVLAGLGFTYVPPPSPQP